MKNQVLEIEADSLDSAREQAKAKTPPGSCVLSEATLRDGNPQTTRGVADSILSAFAEARKKVPADAEIVEEKELFPPTHKSLEVTAFDEETAKSSAREMIDGTATIEAISLKASGRKGFLGFGKKPHLYQIEVFQPAVAEVRFKHKTRIRVEIGEIPSTGYCQMCGRINSAANKSDKSMHFFCSSDCSDRYFKVKIGALLFDRSRFIINASGQDLSGMIASGRAMAGSATSHCWSCGAAIPMTKDKCGSCGIEQEIKV